MISRKMDVIVREINEWQDKVFTAATAQSKAAHLKREADELYDNPTDGGEMADIFILLCGVAHKAGLNLEIEVEKKMAINRERIWGKPDAEGVVEHVESDVTHNLTPQQVEMLEEIISPEPESSAIFRAFNLRVGTEDREEK